VRRVWGECVGLVFNERALVSGNRVSDCYSVGIYTDNARDVLIERNIVRSTTDLYNRVDNGRRMTGINIAVENYTTNGAVRNEDIVIRNNLITGTDRGITYWYDSANNSPENSYRDLTLAHNVICETTEAPVQFAATRGAFPSGNKLINNVMCKGKKQSATGIAIDQDSAWTITNNAYPDGNGQKTGGNSVTGDPGFVNRGGTTLDAYKLRSGSSLIGAGTKASAVGEDAFCKPRKDRPSIGLHEM